MHEVVEGINWWHLGSAYQHNPALGWYILTFAIFLWALIRSIKKPLSIYLEQRSLQVRKGIEEARAAKEASERRLQECEARLGRIDKEIAELVAEFQRQGEQERILLERAAEQVAKRVAEETEKAIQAEVRSARRMLVQELSLAALTRARHRLSEQQQAEHTQPLYQRFLHDIAELPN